jgi:hypothetical protein
VDPPPDWQNPRNPIAPFNGVEGLVWRRLKTHQELPELLVKNCSDSWDWLAYAGEIQWQLELGAHGNQATHFLLWTDGLDPDLQLSFSTNRETWIRALYSIPAKSVYSFPIPPEVACMPVAFARFISTNNNYYNNWIGGWALSCASGAELINYPQLAPIPDQIVRPGQALRIIPTVVDPYAPPDVLTFKLVSGPEGASLDASTGLFSWTPTSQHVNPKESVTIQVDDGSSPPMISTQQFWVSIRTNQVLPILKGPKRWNRSQFNLDK